MKLTDFLAGALGQGKLKKQMEKDGVNLSDEGEIVGWLKEKQPDKSFRELVDWAQILKNK